MFDVVFFKKLHDNFQEALKQEVKETLKALGDKEIIDSTPTLCIPRMLLPYEDDFNEIHYPIFADTFKVLSVKVINNLPFIFIYYKPNDFTILVDTEKEQSTCDFIVCKNTGALSDFFEDTEHYKYIDMFVLKNPHREYFVWEILK